MSDLQIVLIVLGIFIIAGVVVYNWLQERKLREKITDDFIVPQKDVLVEEFYIDAEALVEKEFANDAHKSKLIKKLNEDSRIEPKFSDDYSSDTSNVLGSKEEIETEVIAESYSDDNAEASTPSDVKELLDEAPLAKLKQQNTEEPEIKVEKHILPAEFEPLVTSALPDNVHSQIDLTAFLYATKNINGQALYTMMHSLLKETGVLVMLHGLDQENRWYLINDSTSENVTFKQIACSIQLADRRGPVSKPVLNKFQFAVETIGLEFNAHVEWQGKGDPALRAIDLDKFCMDVDQLVSVHLMQGELPIHGTKFKGLAEANNMQLQQGRFCYANGESTDKVQFVLVNADEQPFTADGLRQNIVRGATFQIEIPKVVNCEEVFTQMVTIAQKMANSLGAQIVDDNQKPLGNLQVEKIRQQLKVIHAKMVARGVMPGSTSSFRLFN